MLIDELKIYIKAGKGGDGVVRWMREKYKPMMGPAGGNGGNGADVYLRGVRDIEVLGNYKSNPKFLAENGADGGKDSLEGKNGEDLFIDLPIGSIVTNLNTGEKYELTKEDETILVLKGGRGGLGNEHFKSSRNTSPQESTPGKESEEGDFLVELQLIADVGFVGLPSAGKSSLLNEMTSARAKVGAYPFTTLEPNLGVLHGYVLADIPGLIEGASEGKGLGHKFLKHIKRTEMVVHFVSFEYEDMVETYKTVKQELEKFNPELIEKPEIILLSKTDLVDEKKVSEMVKEFKKLNPEVQTVSVYDDESIKNFSDFLIKKLRAEK